MKCLMFPGQGCQKQGMGKDLYEQFPIAKEILEKGNEVLGWRITDVMFEGSEVELMETRNTQPSVFLYEVALAMAQDKVQPDVVAGHSLGEFAALVIAGAISLEDGLKLVLNRALIGQKAYEEAPVKTGMGAVIGLSDEYVAKRIKEIWDETGEAIYFANHNGPGQVVITGTKKGVRMACKAFMAEGAKKAVPLAIGGSFHSPFMNEAKKELGAIIESVEFKTPRIPIYQCVDAKPHTNPDELRANLIEHITSSVLWTDMVNNMDANGVNEYYEVGTDDTLQKIVKRMKPQATVQSLLHIPFYEGKIKDYSIIN